MYKIVIIIIKNIKFINIYINSVFLVIKEIYFYYYNVKIIIIILRFNLN